MALRNAFRNPSFELSSSSQLTYGSALSGEMATSSTAYTGANRLTLTTGTGTSINTFRVEFRIDADTVGSVSAGDYVATSIRIRSGSGSALGGVRLTTNFFNSAGTVIQSIEAPWAPLSTALLIEPAAQHEMVAGPAPVGTVRARSVIHLSRDAAGTVLPNPDMVAHLDGVHVAITSISEAAALGAVSVYFDGDGGQVPTFASLGGVPYVIRSEDIPGHGTAMYGGPAGAFTSGRPIPTILYCHGSEGGFDQLSWGEAWTNMRSWLIENGWAWIEGTGGPTEAEGEAHWGNQGARDAYVAYLAWARGRFNVGPVVVLGRSMGGLVASWLLARSGLGLAGGIFNSAVSTMFHGIMPPAGTVVDRSTAQYFSAVAAAYGVVRDSPGWYEALQVAAADFAPELWSPSVWSGQRILHLYGTADTTVPWHSRGGEYMRSLWAGQPTTDRLDVRVGGDHSSANGSYHQVDAMASFLSSIAAGAAVENLRDRVFVWDGAAHASTSTSYPTRNVVVSAPTAADLPVGITHEKILSHEYRFLFADLRNNQVLGELPLQSVSYSTNLSGVGDATGKVKLNLDTAKLPVKSITHPGKMAIYILRDDTPVWGGIVWKRQYSGRERELSLVCKTFESYFYHRFQRQTKYFSQWDQLDIARWLLSTSTNTAAMAGIELTQNKSGVVRDRTMFDYEFKTVGDELERLSNLINGFDWNVNVYRDATTREIKRRLELSYPYAGMSRESTTLAFEYPGSVSAFTLSEDAENSGNFIWAIGAGEGSEQLTATAQDYGQISNNWPVIELSRSYKSVLSPVTLQSHVEKDIERLRTPLSVFEVKINPDVDPAFGSYRLGDWARFTFTDPFLTPAFDQYARITGIDVSVDGATGAEEVSLTLGGDEIRTDDGVEEW